MGADNPGWVPPEAGAVRALPVALALMDRVGARKHDTDRGSRLTDQALGLLGRDAALTIIGPRDAGAAGQIPADCIPEVYDAGFWSRADAWGRPVRPYRARWHCAGIGGARGRVMAWPAAGYGVLAAGGLRGEEDEQA